ncbi:hypothetical protein [Streptomyces sp. RFCAC02]|uniref:hypothetical protein n=1 Tax=Streptomyces sp. RFCAC02 TaxID=2499143 RepID=UPI00101EB42C|nr:hypothetical protein [Streptomyces sp. RFCAC02]
MDIDWATLGQVIVVSVVLTVALVGLFSVGIRAGSSRRAGVRPVGYLGYALCAAAVGYGIFVITA